MKKGFSLLELIFSMVIIAIAFSVLPKILMMATKVSTQSVREEAMFNAVALAGFIHATAWDEKNTQVDDILLVDAGNSDYTCDEYRVGGFVGSRNCKNKESASAIGSDSGDDNSYDDVDDFNGVDINSSNFNSSRQYTLSSSVDYVEDITMDNNSSFSNVQKSESTNTKHITITLKADKKAKELRDTIATFDFYSLNIGQLQINKRVWK